MGCCYECNGLLGLGRVYGLRNLGQPTSGRLIGIPAGSKVRVGFRYSCALCLPGSVPEPGEVSNKVAACLQTTGTFYYVQAQVSQGFVYQDYLTISTQTQRDFASGEDLVVFIRQRLNACYPDFANLIDDNDPVTIDELPASVVAPSTVPMPGSAGGASEKSLGQKIDELFGKSGSGMSTTTLLLLVVGAVVLAKASK